MVDNATAPTKELHAPSERIEACRAVIREREDVLRAFVDLKLEAAVNRADNMDHVPVEARKQLHGVPVVIKEIIDVQGMKCTWGSAAHDTRLARRDAAVVTALQSAGANIIGTTVSTEYAIASAGPTRNPHNTNKTPGGSSSGSAAAIGAGMAELAVGTQTIGSIIRPALYCGVGGFKLSHDAVSLEGVMPLQPILDHIGLFAKDWTLIDRALDAFGLPPCKPSPPGRCFFIDTDVTLSESVLAARQQAMSILKDHGFEIVAEPELTRQRNKLETLARDMTSLGLLTHHVQDFDDTPELWSDTATRLLTEAKVFSAKQIDDMFAECNAARAMIGNAVGPGDIFLSDAIEDVAPDWAADKTGSNKLQGLWSVLGFPTAAWPTGLSAHTDMPVGVQVSAPLGLDRWLAKLMIELSDHPDAGL